MHRKLRRHFIAAGERRVLRRTIPVDQSAARQTRHRPPHKRRRQHIAPRQKLTHAPQAPPDGTPPSHETAPPSSHSVVISARSKRLAQLLKRSASPRRRAPGGRRGARLPQISKVEASKARGANCKIRLFRSKPAVARSLNKPHDPPVRHLPRPWVCRSSRRCRSHTPSPAVVARMGWDGGSRRRPRRPRSSRHRNGQGTVPTCEGGCAG